MNMRYIKYNSAKAGIATALALALTLNLPVQGAAPMVSVDESVYVTMDYYGKASDTSIVKGCDLNGNETFTDYGDYSRVTNMSTNDEPTLKDGAVEWKISDGSSRFYFECVPRNIEYALPWKIDVGYSLNGVPTRAENLAGASGLVQVDVDVQPNDTAGEYYRHNMMLIAVTLVDMEDVKSFRADGAQMQTMGSKKAAIFMAMPGEDTQFSYQIGSESFESNGTFFLMAPITLSQLSQLSDLKDAKARTEDAFDAMNASLDIILGSLAQLPEGLRQTQEAINTLDQAREVIYDAHDGLDKRIDRMNEMLYGASVSLRQMGSDLYDLDDNKTFDDLGNSLVGTGKEIGNMSSSLNAVNNRLTIVKGALDEYRKLPNTPDIEAGKLITRDLQEAISELEKVLEGSGVDQDATLKLLATLKAAMGQLESSGLDQAGQAMTMIEDQLSGGLGELAAMSKSLDGMLTAGDRMIGEIYDMIDDMKSSGILTSTRRTVTSMALLVDEMRNTNMYVQDVVTDCREMINDGLKGLNQGSNQIIDTAILGLDQTDTVRQYKDVIKQTIDNEWDRLANELGLFDIDVEANKISFTSAKNAVPDSIQIILRTQEISIPEAIIEEKDLEASGQNQGVWGRISQVFVKIWSAITQLFD